MSRIAVVTSGFPRRSETFALNELLAMQEADVLEAIFATKPGDADEGQPGTERLAPLVRVLPPGPPAVQAATVAASLEGRRVTGIHGYFAHVPAEVAGFAAARVRVPHGFSVHARDARKVSPDELGRRAARAAVVVACNEDVAGDIRRAGGRVEVLPHGVDLRRFRPRPREAGPVLRLLAVGRLVEKKGIQVLVDAVASLATPFRLRIVGEGPARGRIERAVADAGLRDRVELVGATTHAELPDEIASADVVVVPSVTDAGGDRDGLPNVVLEAMACGRPVVASDVGAISAAIRDGETGLLVPPGDARALARALERLWAHPGLRARLGEAARAGVEREYDLHRCTERLLRRLDEAYAA